MEQICQWDWGSHYKITTFQFKERNTFNPVMIFRLILGPSEFNLSCVTVFTKVCHWSLSWARRIFIQLSNYNTIMSSRLRLRLKNNLFPSGWRTEVIEMIHKLGMCRTNQSHRRYGL